MLIFTKISIFLVFVLALQQATGTEDNAVTEQKVRGIDIDFEKIKSVGKVLSKIPSYYSAAVKLWQVFQQLHDTFAATPRYQKIDTNARLDMLNSKVDQLSKDVKSFKDRLFKEISSKYDRKSLDDKMDNLVKAMKNVNENYYMKFLEYTNSTDSGHEFYILQLAEDAVSASNGLDKSLIEMKTALLDTTANHKNILHFLADQQLINELMCPRQQSAQQSIHVLYEQVMLTEIRAYLMLLFSVQVINEVHGQKRDVKVLETNFDSRMDTIYDEVKGAMKGTSREVWRCDTQFTENQTYGRFRPIFQKYVLHEAETYIADKKHRELYGCTRDCPSITNLRQVTCEHELCTHAFRKSCAGGRVRDCEFKHKSMTVCTSEDSAYRRLEYIKTGDGNVYGVEHSCPRKEVTAQNKYILSGYYCDYCLCTCDASDIPSKELYVNLRPVVSDIHNNKVITGVKIVNGQMIHLQIREGELTLNGKINSTEIDFQSLQNYSVANKSYIRDTDYTQITWDRRTICLDDLNSPDNNKVLTGLKFELHDGKVQLSVRLTEFDFHTGQLVPDNSEWISHNNLPKAPKRSSLSLKYLDIPKGNDANEPRSESGQCIELHTSGLKQDAGQNVVPFLDIQPLVTNPPMPLSGAGLFLRGSDDTGGFLTPKIFTFDLEKHMKKPDKISSA